MSFDSHVLQYLGYVRDESWLHAVEVFVYYCGKIGEKTHPKWFTGLYKIYSFDSAT